MCHFTVAKLMVDEGKRICKDEDACRQKFISLNNGGYFFTNTVNETLKGCFVKDNNGKTNGFWGDGGTEEEISAPYLQDTEERLYCDEIYPTYLPTFSPTNGPECDTVEDCIKLANEKKEQETTATSSVKNSAVVVSQRVALTSSICLVLVGYYHL